MAANQENTADSVKNDVSGAIKMGADAARTAKTVGKVAAHAAAGDVAGAAVELVKDPQTLKKVLLIACIPIFIFTAITTIFLYALPISIYEGASSYFDELGESWSQGVYSSDGGVIAAGTLETIKAGGKIISDTVKTIWRGLISIFKYDSTASDGNGNAVDDGSDSLSTDGKELYVAQNEDAEKSTLEDKITACQKKLDLRASQIEKAILNSQESINSCLKRLYKRPFEVWVPATISIIKPETSKSDAIKLLSAYTVMKGGSLEGQRLSDFMKWLGYYREFSGSNTKFNIGGSSGTTVSVKTWCGTFMPQYLVEQMEQDIETMKADLAKNGETDDGTKEAEIRARYEQYQAPVADLFFTVHSPNFATEVTPIRWSEEGVHYVTASIAITISSRSVESIADDILGFWPGDLNGGGISSVPDLDEPEIDAAA